MREALFNLVGPIDDAAVLDLFAGSGALGLEALSRGARRCVFAQSDRAACRVIQASFTQQDSRRSSPTPLRLASITLWAVALCLN